MADQRDDKGPDWTEFPPFITAFRVHLARKTPASLQSWAGELTVGDNGGWSVAGTDASIWQVYASDTVSHRDRMGTRKCDPQGHVLMVIDQIWLEANCWVAYHENENLDIVVATVRSQGLFPSEKSKASVGLQVSGLRRDWGPLVKDLPLSQTCSSHLLPLVSPDVPRAADIYHGDHTLGKGNATFSGEFYVLVLNICYFPKTRNAVWPMHQVEWGLSEIWE